MIKDNKKNKQANYKFIVIVLVVALTFNFKK